MNTAKVVLLFVLTKYFSTFIRIIFIFFASFQKHRRHTTAHQTANAPRPELCALGAQPGTLDRLRCARA
nr:MAG TPA: hypothetical protein [Caudoviricetes sp.]